MSRSPLSPRPASMSPGQQDIAGGQSIPRRPVGASLSNRSSRQNIDNVNISDTTIDVGLLSPGNERTRLSEVSQSSTCVNETEPLAPHGSYVSPRRTRGYTSVPEDPATYEESFDTDPKPHKNVRHAQYEYRWRRSYLFHLQAWAAEVAWCVVALVLLASVVAILRYYEHKPENTLFGYISLNTIVAFVATLCRAAMVIPISEGISQLKWNAFASGPRSLMDLHAFDQASRGPYGSMMLLFRTRGRLLGVSTIAALVVISSLVTSPLTQATIDYNLPSHKEQKTVTVTGIDSLEAYTPELENALSRAALRSMFTQNYKEDEYRPEPRCPAEHCKWDTFTSLDVCAAVHKITHRVEAHINPSNTTSGSITIRGINSRPYTYDYMPRERLIWDSGPAMDESEYPPEVLAGWNHPDIANVSATFLGGLWMLFVPWNAAELESMERARSLEAIQVIWYWCVNEYTVDMKDGRPTPKPKKSAEIPERHDPSKKKPKEERDSKFKVPRYTHDFIGEAFAGGRLGSTVGATNPIRDELFNIFYPGTYHNGKETNDEALKTKQRKDWDSTLVVEKLANAIAIGMGNVIREVKDEDNDGSLVKTVHLGKARIGEPFLVIRWQWLALLVTQVLFTVLFLAYVIINTARLDVEIVKSSNIAELLALNRQRGLHHRTTGDQERDLPDGIRPGVEEKVHGRLTRHNGEWGLDLQQKTDIFRRGRGLNAPSRPKFWSFT